MKNLYTQLKILADVPAMHMMRNNDRNVQMQNLAATLIDICDYKAIGYGDYVDTHSKESIPKAVFQLYSDMKRKYARLDGLVDEMLTSNDNKVNFRVMKETLSDLSVYGMLGLLLLEEIENGLEQDNQPDNGGVGGSSPNGD